MWNLNLPGAPMVDFHKFFDGENLTQQDLVAWVNVGMHHLVSFTNVSKCRLSDSLPSLKQKILPTLAPMLQHPG